MRVIKLAIIVFVLASSATAAPQALEDLNFFETITESAPAPPSDDEFRWEGQIEAGRTLEIKGVNGSIRAEPASGNKVEVVALKKGQRSNPQDVRVQVVEHAGGITICAVYPSPEGRQPNECRPGKDWSSHVSNNDVRVDFALKVPQGVRFSGHTVNGEVETGLIASDVEATTVNGSIRIAATGYAEASTVNGSINASMGNANWTGPLDFRTVNGEIVLDLPAGTSADVRAETLNGDISTDFTMTVQGRISRRRLNGTIGAGGRELNLKTVNGGIRLRRAS